MRPGIRNRKSKLRVNRGFIAAGLGLAVQLVMLGCDRSPSASPAAPAKVGPTASTFGAPLSADAGLRETLEHPDALQRIPRLAAILAATSPDDVEEVADEIERAPLAWGDVEYCLFASWWARFDPQAAMAYAENELRMSHPRVKTEILRTWGRVDHEGLLKSGWVVGQTMEATGLDGESVDAMVVGWFEGGGEGLEEWIQSIMASDASATAAALRAYVRMRTLRDGDRPTLEWTLTAPFTPDLRRLMLGTSLNLVARRNPELAVEWLDRAKKEGIDVRTFVARIARGWAQSSPKEAVDFAIKASADPLETDRAIRGIIRIWIRKNPDECFAWLAGLTGKAWSDPLRYQATMLYVKRQHYRVDWRSLAEKTEDSVTDEIRQSHLLWIVQHWKLIDQKAAEAWLADHGDRLGPQLEFVDQIMSDDRKAVEQALAKDATKQVNEAKPAS